MSRRKKIVLGIAVCVLTWMAWVVHTRGKERVWMGVSLFHGFEQGWNFTHVTEMFPTSDMHRSSDPFRFPVGAPITLPKSFAYKGHEIDVTKFLVETDTGALLVLKNGVIRYEHYDAPGGRDVHWLSWSVAKSFISALVGIAVHEGFIESIEHPVSRYVPDLKDSGYGNVRIKDVLQMSSGASWSEMYANPFSDVNRFGSVLYLGGSLNEFVAGLDADEEPGTRNRYSSADTQVLGMLIKAATHQSVTKYMERKLWQPLGMESAGYWLLDDMGTEMAFGGLNATARDYAKLGELFRLGGRWRDKQIVPRAWVEASTKPDAPHLTPEAKRKAKDPFPVGYGYQWWIPAGDAGEYAAIGIYNQLIYVNPSHDVVIVKLSAFSDYAFGLDEDAYRELHTIALFRAIVKSLAAQHAP